MRLEPLIINKKHKQININEKISIATRLSKKSNPVFFMLMSLNIINTVKDAIMVRSLNFGATFTFKSSNKPRRKNNIQNEIQSEKKKFLEKQEYKKNKINKEKTIIPPNLQVGFS